MTGQTIRDPKAVKVSRALISVTDKDGLDKLVRKLHGYGVEILSTGGTAQKIVDAGIPVRDVSDYTGFPEMMDGRLKTLHPKVHGGLLARRDVEEDVLSMDEHGIAPIDLLVVNLYPFSETVESGADFDTCIENIDIGGPAMIRAAAKNHDSVAVVTDVGDYDTLLADMEKNEGFVSYSLRKKLAAAAYAHTATYDSNISSWFAEQLDTDEFPRKISFSGNWKHSLRYGENPQQGAALYSFDGAHGRPGPASASQVQGKEMSYNNYCDADAAYELVAEFEEPAAAIIKHANPCGVAVSDNVLEAYIAAHKCDPVSSFGGIVALNRMLDAETAAEITKIFLEVIIAPSVEAEALEILAKKPNIRVLTTGELPDPKEKRRIVRQISGALLVQDSDSASVTMEDLKVVTEREPTKQELEDMMFAFKVCKHVKSNAIVYAKNGASVGIGAGQMSRLDSSRIAVDKSHQAAIEAGEEHPLTKGSVVASDAFFPFADGLLAAAEAGATAAIQPGGSMRDEEVIKAADEKGIAMVFTGMRHFRH